MATVTMTSEGTFTVRWWQGENHKRRTFKTRQEARQFCSMLNLTPQKRMSKITARAMLERYLETESPKKRGHKTEAIRIGIFLRAPWASKTLDSITTRDLQTWFDARLCDRGSKTGTRLSPATVIRDKTVLRAIWTWAGRMGVCNTNPIKDVILPREPDHRERTASSEDIERLKVACDWDATTPPTNTTQLVLCAFLFSCQTGMRSGEILSLEEAWIDGRVVHIPKTATKTYHNRDVALSLEAVRLMRLAGDFTQSRRIFGAGVSDASKDALWRKLRDRAGLGARIDSAGRVISEGLNFHDARATFCTWAASPNPETGAPRLELLALARQTGHTNLKMLQRYYREKAADVACRLD